ncbi:hypothetical protein T4E_9141 [Trichinella pseudospiralis]|uniref:Uncharacterized protein n=1 Tax=Trichinella pseudospiralis TaxID=6337 RepID=A0A0V0XNE3_TRIPS|nr:hypothetical protein T4E_9141 [Trichinella pseudospiralis]
MAAKFSPQILPSCSNAAGYFLLRSNTVFSCTASTTPRRRGIPYIAKILHKVRLCTGLISVAEQFSFIMHRDYYSVARLLRSTLAVDFIVLWLSHATFSKQSSSISCEKFRSFNALKSSYSSTCLRENACKFYFHCSAYACAASVSVFVGLRCAVRVEWRFSLVEAEIFPKWKAKFRVPTYAEVDVRQQEQSKAISGKASMTEISILKIRSRIKIGGTGRGKKEKKGICGLDWDGIL